MEKPANWFAIAKMWEKQLKKKEILKKGLLWDSFQYLLVQTWFLRKQNIDSKWVKSKQLMS